MTNKVNRALKPFRRVVQRAVMWRNIADFTGLFLLLLVALIALDAIFSLRLPVRLFLLGGGMALAGVFLLIRTQSLLRLDNDWVARELDTRRQDNRHSVLTALQVENDADPENGLSVLAKAAVEEGLRDIRRLPLSCVSPKGMIHNAIWKFLAVLIIFTILTGLYLPVVQAVLPRYLLSWADYPPYSSIEFETKTLPGPIIYGNSAEIRTVVRGKVTDEVYLVLRHDQGQRKVRCFIGPDGLRSQEVANVIEPVEYWFTTTNPWGFGRARSKRQKINVLRQPEFTMLSASVLPPAYTGLQASSVKLTGDAIRVPQGGALELQGLSNRPLKHLLLRSREGLQDDVEVAKIPCRGSKAAKARLMVQHNLRLELELEDLSGRRSQTPRILRVECVPDQRPEISLFKPEKVAVAMPGAKVPLSAGINDDYGLAQLRLLCSLAGFRDRSRRLQVMPALTRQQSFEGEFNLGRLGVKPGEKIEFFFEARDNNPYTPGFATSDIYTIRVIPEKEFLEILRMRRSVADFEERMNEVADLLAETAAAAKGAEALLADPNADQAVRNAALKRVRKLKKKLEKLADERAKGPHLYDMEKELGGKMEALRDKVKEIDISPGSTEQLLSDKLKKLQRLANQKQKEMNPSQKQIQRLAKAARVLQEAQTFTRLALQQKELARKLKTLRNSPAPEEGDRARLRSLSREQEKIQNRLQELESNLRKNLTALEADADEKLEELYITGSLFLEALENPDIEKMMSAGSKAGRNGKAAKAWRSAQDAATAMEKLISKCSGMKNGAKNDCLKFQPNWPRMGSTLEQISAGFSSGMGGDGNGYSMGSNNAGNLPLYGAEGLHARGKAGKGGGEGGGRGGEGEPRITGEEDFARYKREKAAAEHLESELFPEEYRDELGAYFSSEDVLPELRIEKNEGKE